MAGAAACWTGGATVALAADAEVAAPSVGAQVEELVVTARRREESLARVPVSVSVVTADALQKRTVSSESDLQTAVPGLVVRSTQGSSQFNYAIRGQSIDAFSASQPGVLNYVNEFQSTALSASSLYDLASVQVLKGPQGTLFGRNTTGGAVLYTTARPSYDRASANAITRVGNLDLRYLEGAVNLPLSSDLAVRIAGSLQKRDGFVRNIVNGEELSDIDRRSARGTISWRPTDRFETTLVGEVNRAKGNGDPLLLYSANAPGAIGPDGKPLVSTIATFYSPILDTLAGPGAFAALRAKYPFTPADGYLGAVTQQQNLGSRRTALDALTGLDAKSHYLVNTSTFELTPTTQLKNIIGYSYNRNVSLFDQDSSPFPFYGYVETINRTRGWSDELQLSGTAMDAALTYIVGAYYSFENRLNGQDFRYFDLGPIANPILGPAFGAPSLPLANQLFGSAHTESYAAFAQVSYRLDALAQGLKATAGLRYTEEKIRFTEISGFAPVFPSNVKEKTSTDKPSWTLGLEYQANEQLFLYATYRGSWRGGGFNYNAPPVNKTADAGGNRFKPETTEDVELGAKFQGRVGDMPARLSVAVYKQWVDDVQRIAYVSIPGFGPAAVTFNAPGANFKGVEADGEISPVSWLRLGGAFNYTTGKYTGATANTLFGTFFEFSTFADLPKRSGSLFAEADVPLGEKVGGLVMRVDAYAQSAMYISNYGRTSAPGTQIPSYELVNARAAWTDVLGTRVTAAIFAKNLFDKTYYLGGIGLGTSPGYNSV
ncbi:MAG TPA: TonB-dependent receptor, partial [Phenylobacterium sp.]